MIFLHPKILDRKSNNFPTIYYPVCYTFMSSRSQPEPEHRRHIPHNSDVTRVIHGIPELRKDLSDNYHKEIQNRIFWFT